VKGVGLYVVALFSPKQWVWLWSGHRVGPGRGRRAGLGNTLTTVSF
jgi:hypothetical protein